MKLNRISLRDVVIFSRVVGAALLVCGYLLAGLYIGRWGASRGWPGWSMPLCLLGGLAAALLAGAREIRSILAMIRRNDGPLNRR